MVERPKIRTSRKVATLVESLVAPIFAQTYVQTVLTLFALVTCSVGLADTQRQPSPQPSETLTCKLAFSDAPSAQEQLNQVIIGDSFFKTRTMHTVTSMLPGLAKKMASTKRGKVVLDLGSGRGTTIASVIFPESTRVTTRRFNETPQLLQAFAPQFQHLRFIGVTASAKKELMIPSFDAEGRYQILSENLFADIPSATLINVFGQKIALAYDLLGVFAYSSTPDLDLLKLHEILETGAEVYIRWNAETDSGPLALFQFPDGTIATIDHYINTYFGELFHAELDGQNDLLKLTAKPGGSAIAHSVDAVYENGYTPPTRIFRVRHPEMTAEHRAINERAVSELIRQYPPKPKGE